MNLFKKESSRLSCDEMFQATVFFLFLVFFPFFFKLIFETRSVYCLTLCKRHQFDYSSAQESNIFCLPSRIQETRPIWSALISSSSIHAEQALSNSLSIHVLGDMITPSVMIFQKHFSRIKISTPNNKL